MKRKIKLDIIRKDVLLHRLTHFIGEANLTKKQKLVKILENWPNKGQKKHYDWEFISKESGYTLYSVRCMASRLGFTKPKIPEASPNIYKIWTPEENKKILFLYSQSISYKDTSIIMGRTIYAVQRQCWLLRNKIGIVTGSSNTKKAQVRSQLILQTKKPK